MRTISLNEERAFDLECLKDPNVRKRMEDFLNLTKQECFFSKQRRWSRASLEVSAAYFTMYGVMQREHPGFPWLDPKWVLQTLGGHFPEQATPQP